MCLLQFVIGKCQLKGCVCTYVHANICICYKSWLEAEYMYLYTYLYIVYDTKCLRQKKEL